MYDLVNAGTLDLIIDTVEVGADPAEARSWWVACLTQKANEAGVELAELAITPAQVARMIVLTEEGELTDKPARKAVDGVLAGGGDVDEVIAAHDLGAVRDNGAIEKVVDDTLAINPDTAEKCRAGDKKIAGIVVGQIMKVTRGKADSVQVNQLIAKKLN